MGFLNQLIETVLMKVVGPLTGKLGKGWKTLAGLVLLAAVAGSHALVEGRAFEPGTLDTIQAVSDKVEWLAWALFGVGVYHKVAAAEPEKPMKPPAQPRP